MSLAVSTNDMTEGSLLKQIFAFSLPLIISNILQVLFNMSDIAVVGHFAGSAALGAVGSTTILVSLFTGFLIGLSGGINVLAAKFLGAKKQRDLEETVHTSAIICLLAGVLLLLIGVTCSHFLLGLLNTKDELIDGASLYLHIYFLGMPALAIYNFGNAVFSAAGDTRKPLFYLLIAGILNVLMNLFFVIVCRLDVAGVAIASVVSQYVSATLILISLFHTTEPYQLCLSKLRFYPGKVQNILALGLPSGFQYAIFQIANLFIQTGVNSFDAVIVEGNSAAANADALVYDVMAAFYTACSSFMGQNYGAGKKDRVLKSYFVSLAYSFGAGIILGGLLVVFGKGFLSLFTTDAQVAGAGMIRLRIMGLSYAVSAFMDCSIAASRGIGKSVIPTVIVIMGSCVFRVIWVYTIFAYFRTIPSLYLLYIFSWTLTAIAEIIYFAKVYKKCYNQKY